jgi:hypothetical protein
MHKLEAIKILEAKLAAIEREHRTEFAGDEDMRDQAESTAEAKALAALFDFLKDCKIIHSDSLLRILERYLRRKSTAGRGHDAPAIQGAKSILAGITRTRTDAGLQKNKAAKWVAEHRPKSGAKSKTGPAVSKLRSKVKPTA